MSLPTAVLDGRAHNGDVPEIDPAIDPAWYRAEIRPLLAGFTLPAIAKAVGVSTSAAAKWRAGRAIPHQRHWAALAELVGARPA
jgi:hypothetical protein